MHQHDQRHSSPAFDLDAFFAEHGTSAQHYEERVLALTVECIRHSGRPVPEDDIVAFINARDPELLPILNIIDSVRASKQATCEADTAAQGLSPAGGDVSQPDASSLTVKELMRRDVIRDLERGALTRTEAAARLGLNVRQIHKLRHRFRDHGDRGLIDLRRFTKGNSRKPDGFRSQVVGIMKSECANLGPTAVHRKLAEEFGVTLHKATIRDWMIKAGLVTTLQNKRRSTVRATVTPQPTSPRPPRYHARSLPPALLADHELRQAARPFIPTVEKREGHHPVVVHGGILDAIEQICHQDDIDMAALVARYLLNVIQSPHEWLAPEPAHLLATTPAAAWTTIEVSHDVYRALMLAVRRVDSRMTVTDAVNHILWIIVRSFIGPSSVKLDDLLNLQRPSSVVLPGPHARQRREERQRSACR